MEYLEQHQDTEESWHSSYPSVEELSHKVVAVRSSSSLNFRPELAFRSLSWSLWVRSERTSPLVRLQRRCSSMIHKGSPSISARTLMCIPSDRSGWHPCPVAGRAWLAPSDVYRSVSLATGRGHGTYLSSNIARSRLEAPSTEHRFFIRQDIRRRQGGMGGLRALALCPPPWNFSETCGKFREVVQINGSCRCSPHERFRGGAGSRQACGWSSGARKALLGRFLCLYPRSAVQREPGYVAFILRYWPRKWPDATATLAEIFSGMKPWHLESTHKRSARGEDRNWRLVPSCQH